MAKFSWVPDAIRKLRTEARRKTDWGLLSEDLPPPDFTGYNLFDYMHLDRASEGVPQVDLKRLEPRKGKPSDRVAAIKDDRFVKGLLDTAIDRGRPYKDWYSIGPFADAFLDANPNPADLERFLTYQTIASQRNPVPQQLKMGSHLYAMDKQGLPIEEMMQWPAGYGSLAQKGIARNAAEMQQGGAIDPLRWPKRTSYVTNWEGNLKPITVDTHGVRLPAMLSGDPRWLAREVPFKDPETGAKATLRPRDLISSGELTTAEAMQRPGLWEAAPSGSEYAQMEDFWQQAARRNDLQGGQAQAAGWVGGGLLTGLKSEPKLFLQSIEDAIKKTAEDTGKLPTQVIKDIANGKMPFTALGGVAVGGGLLGGEDANAAVVPQVLKAMAKKIDAGQPMNKVFDELRGQMAEGKVPVFDKNGDMIELPQAYQDQLNKMGVSTPAMREVSEPEFSKSIAAAKASDSTGAAVYQYDPEAYKGMKKFMTADGTAGFAVKDDGDIVSVFKHADSPDRKVVHPMMLNAIEQGGTKLDAFDTVLPNFYSQTGFRETSRMPWDEKYKPEGWNKQDFAQFNDGEPDVVFMSQMLDEPSKPVPIEKTQPRGSAPTIEDAMKYAKENNLTTKTAHGILSRQYMIDEINKINDLTSTGKTQRALLGAAAAGDVGAAMDYYKNQSPLQRHAAMFAQPQRGEMRGPVNPAAWDIAQAAAGANTPGGLMDPTATQQVAMDTAMGRQSGYTDKVFAGLEAMDPTTWGLLAKEWNR